MSYMLHGIHGTIPYVVNIDEILQAMFNMVHRHVHALACGTLVNSNVLWYRIECDVHVATCGN